MFNDDLIVLLNKAYFYLKFRPRTEKEVREYLYKKIKTTHWSRDDADKIIDELKSQGLIDDKKFVELFVKDRINLKPKGKKLLTYELKKKGIDDNLIENYFFNNVLDEENLALKILKKRWSRFENLDSKKRFEKSARFLLSRGFGYDLVRKTIEKYEENL
ncbi:hypothetical protein B6D29_04975 [Microgenomates bacterium UTCPR1]|nr:RecX family transcriptional regulator [Patescibacteria group bacterium]OQY64575.1 MAG: hypothetical protein B6D29_04975 [Microgenomates bacterium UTCPR1]